MKNIRVQATLNVYYGDSITDLVIANTLNKSLGQHGKIDMIQKCFDLGTSAIAIKICDIYDSYLFYKKVGNRSEMKRSVEFKKLILKVGKDKYIPTKLLKILHNM